MASIRWVSAQARENGTITITKGAGTEDGDRLIAIVIDDEETGQHTPSAPQGVGTNWTLLSSTSAVANTPDGRVYEWKVTNADALPSSWTFTPAVNFHSGIVWVVCIQDLDDEAEVEVGWNNGQLPTNGSRLVTAPSISSYTGENPIVITAHVCVTEYADPGWTAPSGMTDLGSNPLDAAWMTGAAYTTTVSGTGPTGARGAGVSGSTAYYWRAVTVAIPSPVSAPQQTITPTSIPAPAAPNSPALSQAYRIKPATIPAPAAPPEPAVIPGTVILPVGTVPAPAAPPAPRLVQILRPTTIPAPGDAPWAPTIRQTPRPPLRIDFWAVDDDGSLLCPLPSPVSWQISLIPGEPGAVQIEYPVHGKNFHVLDERVTADRDLFIRIRTDGTHARSLGAILQSRDGDRIAESGTVKFYGSFHTVQLDEARILYNAEDPKGEIRFAAATAGEIMDWLLTSVQAAGYLKAGTKGRAVDLWWRFTGTQDSNGTPWPNDGKVSPTWAPGKTLLEVAQQLRDWGLCEFEVTTDHEVRLYVPETVGTDHTLSDPPIVLRRGRDLVEAPRKTDVRSAVTDIAVVGKEGVHTTVTDSSAIARRGRKIAGFVSEGNIADNSSATALGQLHLQRGVRGLDSWTHNLSFDQRRPTPLREFWPADWVYSDTAKSLERKRIGQLTIEQRPGSSTYGGGVVLGDLITDRDVALQRQINKLKSGATVPGVSDPTLSDDLAPATPTGVTASSIAYKDGMDTYATLIVSWQAVTTNVDGSAATDIAGYRVRWILANDLSGGWVLAADTPETSVSFGGVAAGAEVFVQVAAYDRDGNQSAWSPSYAIETETDTTAPPAPSAPLVHNQMGLLMATWDGLDEDGAPMPADFRFVEVHVSIESDFDPDETTLYDRLHGPGTMPITRPDGVSEAGWYGVTRYVKLVAVDWTSPTPNRSEPSAQGSGTPARVLEPDIFDGAVGTAKLADLAVSSAKIQLLAVNNAHIQDLNVGKLTAGTFTAALTLSGIFRTGTTGARGEWDSTSFRMYNSAGVQTIGLVPGGVSFITGEFRTALSGQRMVMNPGGSVPDEIRVYPSASGDYARIMARTAPLDGSAAILIDGGAATGQPRGRVGAYRFESFLSFVTNDSGGDTSAGYSLSAVSVTQNLVNTWYQGAAHFTRYSGQFPVAGTKVIISSVPRAGSQRSTVIGDDQDCGIRFDAGAANIVKADGLTFAPLLCEDLAEMSSRTRKTDEAPIYKPADEVVRAVESKQWRYRRDGKPDPRLRFGPMAEDLAAVMPELVTEVSGETTVSVNSLSGVLWEAVRRALMRIEALEERLAA